ncbi:CDP-diacylglycerol--inositol 3-phosphatidyltransferase [Nematocida sp. AWRm80]|nr:CDP-diacylglycerol--inositol 3-phosphatidyltransferase [Nematocida sp. AWRm80]
MKKPSSRKGSKHQSTKTITLFPAQTRQFYITCSIGGIRTLLLFLSFFCTIKIFMFCYILLYALAILNEYLEQKQSQQSILCSLFNLIINRTAATMITILNVYIRSELSPYAAALIILDITAHYFIIVDILSANKPKIHRKRKHIIATILSIYKNNNTFMCIDILADLFLVNLLCFHSILLLYITLPAIGFKQIVNIVQIYKGLLDSGKLK